MQRRTSKRTGEVQEMRNGQWVTIVPASQPAAPYSVQTRPADPKLPGELAIQGQTIQQNAAELQNAPVQADIARINRDTAQTTLAIKQAEAREKVPDFEQERQKLWNARYKAQSMLQTLGDMRDKVNDKSTGLLARPLSYIGGTDATDLNSLADTIKANLSFDELQKMRDASKTGGALGSITENELKLLSSAVASIDTSQSPDQLSRNIAKVERHYKRSLLSLEGVNPDDFGDVDPFQTLKTDEDHARFQGQLRSLIQQGKTKEAQVLALARDANIANPQQLQNYAGSQNPLIQRMGVGEGVMKGVDHIASRALAGAQAVPNALFGTQFDSGRERVASLDERYPNADPSGVTLGKIVGSLPTAAITNPFTAGAVAGGLMSDQRDFQGMAGDALLGGIAGSLADKAFRIGGNLLSPQIDDAARSLHNRGVRMTPGQIMGGDAARAEGLRTSLPFAGRRIEGKMDQSLDDFTYAAQDEVLAPIGQRADRSIPPGHGGVRDVGERVSREYEDVLGQTSYTWSSRFGQRMLNKLGAARLRPDVAREIGDVVQNEVGNTFSNGLTVSGREWKLLDEQLGELAEHYRKQGGPMRGAASAIRDIKEEMFRDLVRQNGQNAARIRNADAAYRNVRTYRNAATRDGASGTPTPTQLMTSVKMTAPYGRTAFAEGRAPLQDIAGDAQGVLPGAYANSRTAERGIAASPVTREGMIAHAQGAMVAPLYTEGAQRAFQNVMMRDPGRTSQAVGNAINRTPTGLRGMFGSAIAPRVMYGSDGAYAPYLSEEEYRKYAW